MAKAKEYLHASGVDVSNIELSATYVSGYDEYSSILQVWQANLRELGIAMEIRGMEWDAQWAEAQSVNPEDRQDILLMRWSSPRRPSASTWLTSATPSWTR